MNIAYVSVYDVTDPHTWSGIPYHMMKAMQDLGHTLRLVSPLQRRLKAVYALPKLLWNRELQVDREPLLLASYARQIRRGLRGFEADIVFAPSSIPVSQLECKQPILWWTDAVYEGMTDYYAGFRRRNQERAHQQERKAMEAAKRVVYASEWAAEAARRHYPEFAPKISVIPFGANVDDPRVSSAERRAGSPCKLLFLGVDWVRKGGEIALNATRLLNEKGIPAVLRIVGCEPAIDDRDKSYVELYGFVSKATADGRKRLDSLLRTSDLLLLPTRAEAAGIVFCEASAYALPIVATDTGGVSTYVRNDVNGVLVPLEGGPAEYAKAIEDCVKDARRYAQLVQGARAEFEQRLNWTAAVGSLLELGRQAIANGVSCS